MDKEIKISTLIISSNTYQINSNAQKNISKRFNLSVHFTFKSDRSIEQ